VKERKFTVEELQKVINGLFTLPQVHPDDWTWADTLKMWGIIEKKKRRSRQRHTGETTGRDVE
jgi:hypothetical protein